MLLLTSRSLRQTRGASIRLPDTGTSDSAVERYARLFLAAEQQVIDGGAVAPTQQKELAATASVLDAMRANGAEDLRIVLDRELVVPQNKQNDSARLTKAWLCEGQVRLDPGAYAERFVADWKAVTTNSMAARIRTDKAIVDQRQVRLQARMLREPALERALDRAMPERQLRIDEPGSRGPGRQRDFGIEK
ncbi:hypothetical protein [Sphingomonas sp. Leaf25]|uniref:hypothetical protein n=1 Tax=Sphingomonas sp. Leaf25 TaxID=1735692 RepID=UPI00138F0212|nr:hypothetical protein [Sphingomonas sp. Leaf25]